MARVPPATAANHSDDIVNLPRLILTLSAVITIALLVSIVDKEVKDAPKDGKETWIKGLISSL